MLRVLLAMYAGDTRSGFAWGSSARYSIGWMTLTHSWENFVFFDPTWNENGG